MASLLCRKGTYYATFHDATRRPRQRRLSLKTRSKRTAERLLARLEEAYREGMWDAWTQSPDEFLHAERVESPERLSPAVDAYLEYARDALSPITYKPRRAMMRRFARHVGGGAYVERIRAEHVASFVAAGEAMASTQNTRLVALKAFFTFCVDRGMVSESPATMVKPPKRPERLPKAVRDGELEAVLAHLPEGRRWTVPVFRFAALTGLRVSELARLKWSDIDFGNRVLRIERQKNGKAQTQPFPAAAAEILRTLPHRCDYVFASPQQRKEHRNEDVWKKELARAFKIAREAAGIERRITPHGLRHRYCTRLAEAGANAFVIQAAARHADVQTSQRYVSIANGALRDELDRVFGAD